MDHRSFQIGILLSKNNVIKQKTVTKMQILLTFINKSLGSGPSWDFFILWTIFNHFTTDRNSFWIASANLCSCGKTAFNRSMQTLHALFWESKKVSVSNLSASSIGWDLILQILIPLKWKISSSSMCILVVVLMFMSDFFRSDILVAISSAKKWKLVMMEDQD